jgi:hypothetical protein
MGIQYVTVSVNTSGLYQPLASAAGVVGIIGPAARAGSGFSNPTLFTRPLTNDVQTLSVTGSPTGGNFTLSFGGQTTGPITFSATAPTAAQLQTLLRDAGSGTTRTRP